MCFYTKLGTFVVSFIISVIVFFSLLKMLNYIQEKNVWEQTLIQIEKIGRKERKTEETRDFNENIENVENTNEDEIERRKIETEEWKIIIDSIGLEAPIEEGIESEVMNRSVGHFPSTSTKEGNIGLGAHNRGYAVNYFEKIKTLKIGDKIQYYYQGEQKDYIVDNIVIIKDTDWTYLEPTQENRITLITCVENEPEYRRCIQGSQID